MLSQSDEMAALDKDVSIALNPFRTSTPDCCDM